MCLLRTTSTKCGNNKPECHSAAACAGGGGGCMPRPAHDRLILSQSHESDKPISLCVGFRALGLGFRATS